MISSGVLSFKCFLCSLDWALRSSILPSLSNVRFLDAVVAAFALSFPVILPFLAETDLPLVADLLADGSRCGWTETWPEVVTFDMKVFSVAALVVLGFVPAGTSCLLGRLAFYWSRGFSVNVNRLAWF